METGVAIIQEYGPWAIGWLAAIWLAIQREKDKQQLIDAYKRQTEVETEMRLLIERSIEGK